MNTTVEFAEDVRLNLPNKDLASLDNLYKAIESGSVKEVEKMLREWNTTNVGDNNKMNTDDTNMKNRDLGESLSEGEQSELLHSACYHGHEDVFTYLVDYGFPISSIRSSNGNTILHTASQRGHLVLVGSIVERDSSLLNAKNHIGSTPLHLSVLYEQYDTVLALVKMGAKKNEKDDSGVTPIHWAAFHGYDAIVMLLAGLGAVVNITDDGGATPLHWAACKGRDSTVRALVDMGANIEQKDANGATALHEVRSTSTARVLLELGANVNAFDLDGETPLHVAAGAGNNDVLEVLSASARSDINSKDDEGRTPLHIAASLGLVDTVQLLVKLKAKVTEQQSDGASAALVALKQGHRQISKMLVKAGDVDFSSKSSTYLVRAIDEQDMEGIEWFIEIGTDIREALSFAIRCSRLRVVKALIERNGRAINEWINESGDKPLHIAAANARVRIVGKLIEMGANVNARNKTGQTPLMMAAGTIGVFRQTECISMLLSRGAEVDDCDCDGNTALMQAISAGSLEVVAILLKRGANVSHTSASSFPLLLASELENEEMVAMLLKHGAKINKVHGGGSALQRAVERGSTGVVEYLISMGADINLKFWDGTTSIWHASRHGHIEIVKRLLSLGARLSTHDNGTTTLVVAINNEHKEVVRLLLEYGADVREKNRSGETLLLSGVGTWDKEMMEIFLKGGGRSIIETPNERGQTPLLLACKLGKVVIVGALLENGADVKAKDKEGQTPMMIAANRYHKDIMQMLATAGSEIIELAETCTICLEDCVDPVKLVPCGHHFCLQCTKALQTQRQFKCPNCRKPFQTYSRV